MAVLHMNAAIDGLRAEEERILSNFTRRLIEITAVAGARSAASSSTAILDAMRLPALALDQSGIVIDINSAAEEIFDPNIKIKESRLYIRDLDARMLLKDIIDRLNDPSGPLSLVLEPVIVPRLDKLPVILRIWPVEGPAPAPGPQASAILTLNALGPKPGPAPGILAKTFHLTPAEARLACIIARGAPPDIAARELKISRETARNQLKSVFAKTDTHRQSELVALLLQVQ